MDPSFYFHTLDVSTKAGQLHFGVPFDEGDVRGVCGIAESRKGLTAIGRFGIGFKSVYAFSDRPEVHSGSQAFAIENFVWPVATDSVERKGDETVIFIPLRQEDDAAKTEIADGLSRLGTTALLFLQEIEESGGAWMALQLASTCEKRCRKARTSGR